MFTGYNRRLPVKKPTKRQQQAKLMLLILMRSTHRHLKQQFNYIKDQATKKTTTVKQIANVLERFAYIHKTKAWEKLKHNVLHSKQQQRIFKDVMNLSKRIQVNIKLYAFQKIQKKIFLSNSSALDQMSRSKKYIMFQTLKKLLSNRKQSAYRKIQDFAKFNKQKKRVLVIGMIYKSAQKRLVLNGWSKLMLFCGKSMSSVFNKTQHQDLNLQVQDLKVQVENKNMNISRLQQQIEDLRQSSYRQEPNSFYYNPLNTSALNRSGRSSRKKLNSSVEKDSFDGSLMKDLSFGSIFTGSVRSRGSTKKGECHCEYSSKYQKYKAAAQSYKNQLQIIKAELQFTKQMNDHMENQIKLQVGSDEKDRKIERLRSQIKEIQRDRDHLVEKVAKYQKYTAKLKSEFKMKIQQIYRKVKKGH